MVVKLAPDLSTTNKCSPIDHLNFLFYFRDLRIFSSDPSSRCRGPLTCERCISRSTDSLLTNMLIDVTKFRLPLKQVDDIFYCECWVRRIQLLINPADEFEIVGRVYGQAKVPVFFRQS